jgi:hypothetical protein
MSETQSDSIVVMDGKSLAIHFPHIIVVGTKMTALERLDAIDEARAWCEEHLGETSRIGVQMVNYIDTQAAWLSIGTKFHFKDPNHAVWFRLACC